MHIRRKGFVHENVATGVYSYSRSIQPEIVCVGPAPDRQEYVRPLRDGSPEVQLTPTATPSACDINSMQVASVRTTMPSSQSIWRTASDTSSSSWAINRGPLSMITTSAPKRLYI